MQFSIPPPPRIKSWTLYSRCFNITFMIRFGPSGNSYLFYNEGHKSHVLREAEFHLRWQPLRVAENGGFESIAALMAHYICGISYSDKD